jgi:hypothetical protein
MGVAPSRYGGLVLVLAQRWSCPFGAALVSERDPVVLRLRQRPSYEWTAVCERKFGSHPTQICFEWNTISHAEDAEGAPERRALTRRELQDFLDHADARASTLRAAGRKGWLSALRDVTAFKIAYAYGLRRRELTMLDPPLIGQSQI